MKDSVKRMAAVFIAAALLIAAIPLSIYATGSYYVSSSSLTVTQGSSTTFTFGATNAVGAFEISTDGGVSASCSSEHWVDDSTVTITVKGNTVGTGHVYISVYDGADYDGNDLSGKSYTVTVTVKSASGGTVSETTTVSSTEATTTTAQTTEETTTADPEIELLTVAVDGSSMLIVKDLSGLDVPDGFEIEETVYNTVAVETFVYDDIVIYVLEDEDGNTGYYTLSDSGDFEALRYITLSGMMCIFLDMPDDLSVPSGYSIVETEIYGFTVEALVFEEDTSAGESAAAESDTSEEVSTEEESSDADDSDDSEDSDGVVEIISVYTVAASEEDSESSDTDDSEEETGTAQNDDSGSSSATEIDDMLASSEGHYYVYCLLGTEKVLCDYDSETDSLQRCTAIAQAESETAEETSAAEIEEDTQTDDSFFEFVLLLSLAAAAVIIIVLVIVVVVLGVKKHGLKKKLSSLDELEFEEEDVFAGEYRSSPPEAERFSAAGPVYENSFYDDDSPEFTPQPGMDEPGSEAFPDGQSAQGAVPLSDIENFYDEAIEGMDIFEDSEDAGILNEETPYASEDAPAENPPQPEQEITEDAFGGDVDVEDISDILSEEFADIMKYVGEDEQ